MHPSLLNLAGGRRYRPLPEPIVRSVRNAPFLWRKRDPQRWLRGDSKAISGSLSLMDRCIYQHKLRVGLPLDTLVFKHKFPKLLLKLTSRNAKIVWSQERAHAHTVRIISRKKIREAVAKHGEWEASLNSWYKITKGAKWKHFPDIKQSWKRSDVVGSCVVFDISHNKCRLVAYISYRGQRVYILHILSHIEYGRDGWKDDCDCD